VGDGGGTKQESGWSKLQQVECAYRHPHIDVRCLYRIIRMCLSNHDEAARLCTLSFDKVVQIPLTVRVKGHPLDDLYCDIAR
jgi:hypothetical protein